MNKDTNIYGSFSSNPGNNGCIFFNRYFKKFKYNSVYKSFFSDNIKQSIEAVKSLNIKGFALSMPFKIEVLNYVDEIEKNINDIGSINTVTNLDGHLKGFNTDWLGVKSYFKNLNLTSIYIAGDGGFSKAIQYTCDYMDIEYKIINRKNWNLINELKNKTIVNATPLDLINTKNKIYDFRPHKDQGKKVSLYQAKEQFKIYTGQEI